ncbi:MAG: carboxypeptidase regulatory-like domain-containing protein [Polyangiaceae bacterium]|nr:carboxypeptidase regulatory-like domain-containing protein [Polyangiaceae bacterium]
MPRSFLSALPSLILFSSGCSDSALIEGKVLDPHGAPLDGVSVKVLKSTFETKSSPDGSYEVPFAPGTFQVQFSKDGYTSHALDLDIQQAMRFPAEPSTLYPIPQESGLFWLSQGGLKAIDEAPMDTQRSGSGFSSTTTKIFCTGEGTLVLPQGRLQFVDTSDSILMVARLGGYGLVYAPKDRYDEDSVEYNGLLQDEKQTVGEQSLLVRSFDAEPGQYAWVKFKRNKHSGETTLDPSQPCQPFKVAAEGG